MLQRIKRLLAKPSAEILAVQEIDDARREHLAAMSATEYYESLSRYHSKRIERLERYLREVRRDES